MILHTICYTGLQSHIVLIASAGLDYLSACLQNTQEVNLAAAYSEDPTPCHSSRGSYTTSAAGSARGNKENGGVIRRRKANVESKHMQNQTHTLLGGVPSICLNIQYI